MIKIILYDADGVVIEPRKKYFSSRLIDEFNIPKDKIDQFVKESIIPSMIGKADIREDLSKHLKEWDLNMSVDEMLKIWWSGENTLNGAVLKIISDLKEKGLKQYLASDQEKYRARYILEDLGLNEYFDGAFFSYELGYGKSKKEFWKFILSELNTPPEEILFWDDDEKNVLLAKEFGIHGMLYTNFLSFSQFKI